MEFSKDDISIFKVRHKELKEEIESLPRFRLWPLVYILYNEKNLYVGETADIQTRFAHHNQHILKRHLLNRIVITSGYFNKSATLQLEAYLIKLLSADGKYKLLNINTGISEHNYYNQQYYEEVFPDVWEDLKMHNLAAHTVAEINNSDLFKYSPYKSLNTDQQDAIINILEAIRHNKKTVFVRGGAGTGKTILAIYLMKLLCTPVNTIEIDELEDTFASKVISLTGDIQLMYPDPSREFALVVPMTSLRGTLKKVFKNIQNLSASMVIAPTDAAKRNYGVLLVDEAHRLKRRINIVNYKSHDDVNELLNLPDGDELDWVLMKSKSRILFYDEQQSIKPSDIPQLKFDLLLRESSSIQLHLLSQIRSKGGNLYSSFVANLLSSNLKSGETFESDHYELRLVDNIEELKEKIELRDKESGLSRLVAGFAWEWKSKKNRSLYDIEIDQMKFQWNSTNSDWINSTNALNEIGCIHTTQGYDLNYVGIIFGKEISFDKERQQIVIKPENYKDKNGKNGVEPSALKSFIISIYQTLLLRGILGTYIYCMDPDLKAYFRQHIN